MARAFLLHAERMEHSSPDLSDLDERDEDDWYTACRRRNTHRERYRDLRSACEVEVRVAEGLVESYGAPAGTRFYVTATQGEAVAVLAGPFESHETALRLVPSVRAATMKLYPLTFPCAWGTVSIPPGADALPVMQDIHNAVLNPPAAEESSIPVVAGKAAARRPRRAPLEKR